MAEVTINYKGATIATMDASGTKTLNTRGKYCEGDIGVVYAKPVSPSGTKQISITQNGTTTEDVTNYASAEITVNVSGGGGVGCVIETRDLTVNNAVVNLDREFDNFILIAYLTDEPSAYPANGYVCATMTAYVDGLFWPPAKHYTVKSNNGTSLTGQNVSPSNLTVSATNIAWATRSSNYNVVGKWTFVLIEVTDDMGMYSWQKVAEDIAGGA